MSDLFGKKQGRRILFHSFSLCFIVMGITVATGCVGKQKYHGMMEERDDCMSEKEYLTLQVDSLEAENELLYAKLVARKAGTAVIHGLYEELVADLEKEIASHRIVIHEMKSGVVVVLSEAVLFPSGSVSLTDSGRKVLMKVGEDLKKVPFQILVAGFTDDRPVGPKLVDRFPSNWELAGARAAGVVRVLETAGVAREQLRAVSFGENSPVASNDDAEGRARNRRIEIRMRPVITENE